MGKNEDPNLQQREQSLESGNNQGHPGFLCGRCWMVLSRLSNEFSFRCVFVLFLSLSIALPGIFWILPFRSINYGFDAKQAVKLSASVHAYFTLQKPVSELVQHMEKLRYDIYDEIGVPATKVAILSMHRLGASNSTYVVFGVLSDPINSPINPVSLSVLRSSLIELFLQQSNLTLTTSIFGQPSDFEILKFPGGITVIPTQPAFIWQITQILFNFTLNNSIAEIQENFIELKDQLKYGLLLTSYENLFLQLTNENGSTISSPVIVQASVTSSDFGDLLPQRLKQLAQTITESPAKNLGLNNSVFGKVKSISLSSYLKGTLHAAPPTPSPAPSPGPSISPYPTFSPTHSPASSPKSFHLPPCPKCKAPSPSDHSPLHSPGPGIGHYPSFPPPISPAPSSAAPLPCPYSRPAVPPSSSPRSHSNLIPNYPPVMSPRSQLSPDQPPLPSVSYGSRPGQGMDSTKDPVSAPLAQSPSAQPPSWMVEAPVKSFQVFPFPSGKQCTCN
ncbi:leucine-rich repeat extensin-like protein 2 isoform X2 [Durio zibethinus]|uniref:Leucine-rich repeat extensin-like protein 2 isoform X2 n=1 Tax=Durio zibethinus TaxID=66656 RepID=A0A6P6ADI6_DURZI|nr:leucine-rich repeat extensin-like protein 2 isoform X2 [Durio zibethinus]